MANDLYFIAYLCRGLGSKDPRTELRPSIEEIVRLGPQKGHARGYRQFLQFVAAVRAEVESMSHRQPQPLFDHPPLAAIHAAMATQSSSRIRIERGGDLVSTCDMAELPCMVPDIAPGRYRILLDTGWTLWEGHLRAHQLTWAGAFGDRPLQAAAATEQTPAPISFQADLLQGLLKLTITPGLESGSLSLARR